jgi:hypothetical protein
MITRLFSPPTEVPTAEPLVVWVFRKSDGFWSLRREGDRNERNFRRRGDAVDLARCLADVSPDSRLFIQTSGGRFVTECRSRVA